MTDRDVKDLLNTLHAISRGINAIAKEMKNSSNLTLQLIEAAESIESDEGFAHNDYIYDDENPIAEEAPEEDE